jgi:hypothetical protein
MTVPDVVRDRPTTLDFWGIHPTVVTNWRRLRIEQPLSDNIDYDIGFRPEIPPNRPTTQDVGDSHPGLWRIQGRKVAPATGTTRSQDVVGRSIGIERLNPLPVPQTFRAGWSRAVC